MNKGRRRFIKAVGSLTVLFSLKHTGLWANEIAADPELPGILKRVPAVSAWLEVLANGGVRVFTGKVEIGQGICGAIAQVTAEELDMQVKQVEVVIADTRRTPNEGFTGASSSTENSVLSVRYAAATARLELLQLASARLNAPADALQMKSGLISRKDGKGQVSFFALLDGKQLTARVQLPLQLKAKKAYTVSGKAIPREDIGRMLTGTEPYLHDIRFDGMVHARVIRPTVYNATLNNFEEIERNHPDGVLKLVRNGNFLAVICADEYKAVKAQRKLNSVATWTLPVPPVATSSLPVFIKALPTQTRTIKTAPVAFPETSITLKASYAKPYIMHGAIGPSCAVAVYKNDALEVWTHAQGAYPIRDTLNKILNIPAGQINVSCVRGAGCYGQNGAEDAAVEAAVIAVAFPGRHVRLQWSREEEHGWEPFGSAMCMDMEAVLNSEGRITDFRNAVWSDTHYIRGAPGYLNVANQLAEPFPRIQNPVSSGGYRNADLYYAVPNQTVTAHFFNGPLHCSNLRSLGAYGNLFAVESFIDELAGAAKIDPFAFRLMHLEDDRAKRLLVKLKDKISAVSPQKDTGIGLAFSRYKNTAAYCAVAAQVLVDSQSQELTLVKMWAVADAGEVISLDSVKNQLEGGMLQAASWTLFEEVKFEGQQVTSNNWATYPIIRFKDVPSLEVEIISSPDEKLEGVGEIAQGVTAAAIVNAIAKACKKRIRRLPVGKQLRS